MALFKKDSENKTDKIVKEDNSWVLIKPRITEKTAMISSNNVYTFDVNTSANKIQVKKAILEKYNVTPIKINIISKKPRKITRRGQKVHKTSSKKAMVYLKKGDSIELV